MKWYNKALLTTTFLGMGSCATTCSIGGPETPRYVERIIEIDSELNGSYFLNLKSLTNPATRDSLVTLAEKLSSEQSRLVEENREGISRWENARWENVRNCIYSGLIAALSLASIAGVNGYGYIEYLKRNRI